MTDERVLNMPHYTALVTLLAVALYFYTGLLVAKARQKFGVVASATTGNLDFERVFRVQDEHAGMDADLPAAALVFCALCQRLGRSAAGAGLDRRPDHLHPRLRRSGGQAPPRLRAASLCLRRAFYRNSGRHFLAPGARRVTRTIAATFTPPR